MHERPVQSLSKLAQVLFVAQWIVAFLYCLTR